jgi:hypothetical protein
LHTEEKTYLERVDIYNVFIRCSTTDEVVDALQKVDSFHNSHADAGYPYGSIELSILSHDPALADRGNRWYRYTTGYHVSACYIQELVDLFGSDRVTGIATMMPEWWERFCNVPNMTRNG